MSDWVPRIFRGNIVKQAEFLNGVPKVSLNRPTRFYAPGAVRWTHIRFPESEVLPESEVRFKEPVSVTLGETMLVSSSQPTAVAIYGVDGRKRAEYRVDADGTLTAIKQGPGTTWLASLGETSHAIAGHADGSGDGYGYDGDGWGDGDDGEGGGDGSGDGYGGGYGKGHGGGYGKGYGRGW